MFGFIIRPFRVIHRHLGRTPIEKREAQALVDTRKVLLTYRSASENSKAQVSLYTERVERLKATLAVEQGRQPEKRSFDWVRFDNNTLLVAIKDDLYEAEKKLHEALSDYESNSANVAMFEAREVRLDASLAKRKVLVEAGKRVSDVPMLSEPASEVMLVTGVQDGNMVDGQLGLIPDRRETIAAVAAQAVARNSDIAVHSRPVSIKGRAHILSDDSGMALAG